VYGWGRGSGVFLACCEKVILPLKTMPWGRSYPPQVKFLEFSNIEEGEVAEGDREDTFS